MLKVSYNLNEHSSEGTHFTQKIKVDFEAFNYIMHNLNEEIKKDLPNINKYLYGQTYYKFYLKRLNEIEQKKSMKGTTYYLNNTLTRYIKYITGDKRILERNTVLYWDYKS